MKRQSPVAFWGKGLGVGRAFPLAGCIKGKRSGVKGATSRKRLSLEQLEGRRLLATLPGLAPVLLEDLTPGQQGSMIDKMVTVGDHSFFIRNQAQLWSTQGQAGDPQLIADFTDGSVDVAVQELAEHSGKLVFQLITKPTAEPELEKFLSYDPQTKALQTWLILDSTQHSGYLYPDFFVSNGSDLYFFIMDDDTGSEIWTANQDLTSTTLLQSIGFYSYPDQLQTLGSRVVFAGDSMEAWTSDGTVDGTHQIRDVIAATVDPFKYAGVENLNGGQPQALATADFDNDGTTDFVVPGQVLFGDGQGGVLRKLSYGDFTFDLTSTDKIGLQAIDYDRDGDQDVAVALSGALSQLRVYQNDGFGQLTLAIEMDLPGISRSLAIGSLDAIPGDDLLVPLANAIYQLIPGTTGTLSLVAVATHQTKIDQFQAKDLNGDGLLDLVTSQSDRRSGQTKSLVTILKQTSAGVFEEQSRSFLSDIYEDNLFVNQIALADWNGDGLQDLLIGDNEYGYFIFGSSRFGVILQTATGFDGEVIWNNLPGRFAGMHVAPPNGGSDGFVLIGVRNPQQWLVYPLKDGVPVDANPVSAAMDQVPSSIASGDFNGDGLTDFSIGNWDSLVNYTNFSGGSFGIYPSKPLTGEVISSVAYREPGDVQDTIVTLSHIQGVTQISKRGAITEVVGAPAGYVPEVALPGRATKVLAESLKGTPAKDLVILFPEGPYVSIFQDGSFLQDQRIALGSGAEDMAAGDWNGDGMLDLAVSYPAVHRVVVYQQNSVGGFAPSIIRDLPGGGEQLLSVDADGDGDRDLVTPDAAGSQLHIMPAVPGGFSATESVSIPGGPKWVQFADMDHVGLPDLVATTLDMGMIVALRDGMGNVYSSHREEMASLALDLDLADISGDGWTDVIVTPSTGNQALVYYGAMDGEVGYAIPQWVGVGMRQLAIGSVENDTSPGLFMMLQTIPNQLLNQQGSGYVVEMRPDEAASPLSAYLGLIPRDAAVEKSYFLSSYDGDWFYGYDHSLHLPGYIASVKKALWTTDGTSHGTQMIYDFENGEPYHWFAGPDYLVGAVYNFATSETELWKSDGTAEGTQSIRSFLSVGDYKSNSYVAWNGKIYFPASTSEDGMELWVTDGTPEGTKKFYDFLPGVQDGIPYGLEFLKTPTGFYFTAITGEHGREIWFSDGTEAGTLLAGDVEPGPNGSDPTALHWDGQNVLFVANTLAFGSEAWALGSVEYDFGDAPDTYGTRLSSDGPRHRLGGGLYLGFSVDSEADGAPSSLANLDDTTGSADEDAATSPPRLVQGAMNPVTLIASGTGYLDLWLDANQDGQFSHPEEHFTLGESVLLSQGENTFHWMLPANALVGVTYARLRYSTGGGLLPTGEAQSGEVEDHRLVIRASDTQSDWQNPRDPLDTNYSGDVKPSDALVIINYLNSVGQGPLPPNPGVPLFWYDVNGDGSATPLDALRVINYLNLAGAGGEGENSLVSMTLITTESTLPWPFASFEVIGSPYETDDGLLWDEQEVLSDETFEAVALGDADDTTYEPMEPGDNLAYVTTTESVDQLMNDAELESILMATPPLQTQLSSFWMELRKRMAGKG
jgi:ELWxxDGT repeat protein